MNEKESLSEKTAKNSIYNLISSLISKFGGLLFTIILARLLLPASFGIYNLVLSVVMIFVTFTSLGIGGTLVRYMSEALGNNKREKARSYFRRLIKIKGILLAITILIIILSSKFLANNVFQKPVMFWPLILASFYILTRPLFATTKSLFKSLNDFRRVAYIQFTFYFLRIVLVVLAIYLVSSFLVSAIFLVLALTSILCGVVGFILLKGDRDLIFGPVEKIETKRILSYLGYISLVAISLKFFGNIDTLMLGRFVEAEFIGYYRAALSLIASAAGLFGFGTVLLPIFTRINKEKFRKGFQKVFRYIIILIIPATIGVLIVGRYFIFAIYGGEYITATTPLYALALLVIIAPMIGFYTSLLKAKEKPKLLFKAVIFSLVLNIILNYALIKYFLNFSQELAILGAGLATIVSRGSYLFVMVRKTKSILGLKARKTPIIKSLIASIVMAFFLVFFTWLVDMNWIFGVIEIILGVTIYFFVLWLIKGINKEDWDLFSGIVIKKLKKMMK